MLIVGLTGSIGMGKSTAAARFRHLGVEVFDADVEVHRLYAGPLVAEIEREFPGTVEGGVVDRSKLSARLVADPKRFRDLEGIVHPRVRESERRFLHEEFSLGAPVAVLEIPLLFEIGADEQVDMTVVVSATSELQRQRVVVRPGMTEEKFKNLVVRQLSEAEKTSRADFVVDTGGSIDSCNKQIDVIVTKLRAHTGDCFVRYWRD